jgi:hypothetical protein
MHNLRKNNELQKRVYISTYGWPVAGLQQDDDNLGRGDIRIEA